MKTKFRLIECVMGASFGALVVGLNIGGISGALEFLTADFGLSPLAMGLVTGVIMIGCLIGALLGGRCSDKYGRKKTMLFSSLILITAALWCFFAGNTTSLVIARFVCGCGMGVLSVVTPIYISEISPTK